MTSARRYFDLATCRSSRQPEIRDSFAANSKELGIFSDQTEAIMNAGAPFESDPTQRKKAVHVKVSDPSSRTSFFWFKECSWISPPAGKPRVCFMFTSSAVCPLRRFPSRSNQGGKSNCDHAVSHSSTFSLVCCTVHVHYLFFSGLEKLSPWALSQLLKRTKNVPEPRH